MTLDDLERQNRGFCGIFFRYRAAQVYIIHKATPRFGRLWRGVVGNAFRLKRSLRRARLILRWMTTEPELL